MRNRFMFLGLSASVVMGAAAFLACSGSTEPASGGDAGAVDSGSRDTGIDSAPSCDPDASFVPKIPDASIADGASSTGVCLGCVQVSCKSEIDKCNQDCTCQGLADKSLACYAQNSSSLAAAAGCITDFFNAPKATRDVGFALFGCVRAQCATECAVDTFMGDAGDPDAADADGG